MEKYFKIIFWNNYNRNYIPTVFLPCESEVNENCCKNLIDVSFRSFELMRKELSKYELDGSDYLIKIKSKKVSLLDMSKIDEFYKLGYNEAIKLLEFLEDN